MNWNNLDDIIINHYENYFDEAKNKNEVFFSTKKRFFKNILLPILRVKFIYGYLKFKSVEDEINIEDYVNKIARRARNMGVTTTIK